MSTDFQPDPFRTDPFNSSLDPSKLERKKSFFFPRIDENQDKFDKNKILQKFIDKNDENNRQNLVDKVEQRRQMFNKNEILQKWIDKNKEHQQEFDKKQQLFDRNDLPQKSSSFKETQSPGRNYLKNGVVTDITEHNWRSQLPALGSSLRSYPKDGNQYREFRELLHRHQVSISPTF